DRDEDGEGDSSEVVGTEENEPRLPGRRHRCDATSAGGVPRVAEYNRKRRMTGQRPHVVIVGGGFAGLRAARALRRAPVDVTLLDRRNHHVFQPLLYQVATAGLSAPEIAAPLRSILRRQPN